MVESKDDSLQMKFLEWDQQRGFTMYHIRVEGPNGKTFHIKDRYKSMRQFQSFLKRQLPASSLSKFGMFPPKKMLGNKNPAFVQQRKEALQIFFNKFFADPNVKNSKNAAIYLKDHAVSDLDKSSVDEALTEPKKSSPTAQQSKKPATMNMGGNPNMIKVDAGQDQVDRTSNLLVANTGKSDSLLLMQHSTTPNSLKNAKLFWIKLP